ncbi:MAG: DNA-deoxyinosine glycosylase [Clostridia bacterium]|nr:DNA-deoxyinosine glycosylase [Clostridia bacterium]
MITHPIPPVYDACSTILILGSFPSVKSREQGFFYGHPQNRFWRVLAAVYHKSVPQTVVEKRDFLLSQGIALWDVVASCEIIGSADHSIKQVIPNNIEKILRQAHIRQIFVNGKTALKYYGQYLREQIGKDAVCLPSTSPANAAWSLERLVETWRAEILQINQ